MGGWGFWTGLGFWKIGSKSTCSPWYSACSEVQISFMASTRSRIKAEAPLMVGAVVGHLLKAPAGSNAEEEPAP